MLKLSRLKILLSLVASLTSLGLGAAAPQSPRLLVGIMVEGLDGDCLELLREQFGNGGFRKPHFLVEHSLHLFIAKPGLGNL